MKNVLSKILSYWQKYDFAAKIKISGKTLNFIKHEKI